MCVLLGSLSLAMGSFPFYSSPLCLFLMVRNKTTMQFMIMMMSLLLLFADLIDDICVVFGVVIVGCRQAGESKRLEAESDYLLLH